VNRDQVWRKTDVHAVLCALDYGIWQHMASSTHV